MRISDWSSDVCSSDLRVEQGLSPSSCEIRRNPGRNADDPAQYLLLPADDGRASRRDSGRAAGGDGRGFSCALSRAGRLSPVISRSEEHTSELQSLMRISYPVFCLI